MGTPTNLRIAIVGAGPAGISIAWYLHRLGFRAVELFDAADEVGGQSHTIDVGGIPIEMGTCYLADGYIVAREMAHDAGVATERLPPATFLDEQGHIVQPPMPATMDFVRYLWRWFGWYFSGQLWTPDAPDNALAFDAWLRAKGLGDLATSMIFADGCTAQLYGPLDAITAHNGLSWVRPSLLLTGRREDTAHLPAGFQTMWRKLLATLGYRVHLGTAVEEVRGVPDTGEVDVVRRGAPGALRFDHVFIACPLDETPANAGMRLRHPLSAMLRDDFAPFDATTVYSGIWRGSRWPLGAPSRCYLPAASKGERGRLLTIRQYGKVGDEWVGQLCAYATDGSVAEPADRQLRTTRDQVVRDMEQIVGLRDVGILHDRLWRYSVRYSAEQLQQGLPAAIAAHQGVDHVWYTGGGLSHWDVDMIANFNQSLAWRFGASVGLSWMQRLAIVHVRDLFRDL